MLPSRVRATSAMHHVTSWIADSPVVLAESLLPSPRAVLYFYRMSVAEAMVAFGLLMMQLALFANMAEADRHNHIWVALVGVPQLVTAAKLALVVIIEFRCSEMVQRFQYGPVVEEVVAFLDCRESRAVRKVNVVLCVWHLLCVLWLLLFPPCGNLAQDPGNIEISFNIELVPCMAFEFICTLHLLANALLGSLSHAGLKMVRRRPRSFIPARGGGVPPDLLDWLPTCQVGGQPNETHRVPDNWSGSTCTICLQDFVVDDTVRQLPCGHGFHMSCADGWLALASTCPLRCKLDVRKAAQEKKFRQCKAPFIGEFPGQHQELESSSMSSDEIAETSVSQAEGPSASHSVVRVSA